MISAGILPRRHYVVRWLALTGLALLASVGVVFATRTTGGETLVLAVWAAWMVIKIVALDVPRLRHLGWSERWALASLFPPIGMVLQVRLLATAGPGNISPVAASQQHAPASTSAAQAFLSYYQPLGFFAGLTVESLREKFHAKWSHEPKFETPWDELFLLALDRERTWTSDPEADVCAENSVYATVIEEWARLTGGHFAPSNIAETWASGTGPVRVAFRLNGEEASVSPQVRDDWVDLDVLGELNFFTIGQGGKFNYAIDGDFCLVTYLPIEVDKRLRTERRLPLVIR